MTSALKYTYFDEAPGSTHNLVADLVPEGARVLEFGCASGYMSRVLREERGCTIVGIEIVPEAAEEAKAECERVIVGDAEAIDFEQELGDDRFDAVMFADVLEHLREPAQVLRRVRPFLKEDGVVIASIPNIAHGNVRLALLAGEFRYRPLGLLDETHLRFFTRDGVSELFEQAGLFVTEWIYKHHDIGATEITLPELPFAEELRTWLARDQTSTVYQFIVRARPASAAKELAEVRRALQDASDELAEIRRLFGSLGEIQERVTTQEQVISALRGRIATQTEEIAEQRKLFRTTQGELITRDHELRQYRSEIELARRQASELEDALNELHETKAWRAIGRFWDAKAAAKRMLGNSR